MGEVGDTSMAMPAWAWFRKGLVGIWYAISLLSCITNSLSYLAINVTSESRWPVICWEPWLFKLLSVCAWLESWNFTAGALVWGLGCETGTTIKRHFSEQVLFGWIMRGHIWSHKFVSHYISLAYTSTTPTSSHDATFKCTFALNQHSSTPQIVELVTDLFRYFQAAASLPTVKEMALTILWHSWQLQPSYWGQVQQKWPRKRKAYTAFTAEQRVTIGNYAWKRSCSEVQGRIRIKDTWLTKMQ